MAQFKVEILGKNGTPSSKITFVNVDADTQWEAKDIAKDLYGGRILSATQKWGLF